MRAMIEFQCPACQKVLRVNDDSAGRKAACRGCGHRLQIPLPGQDRLPEPAVETCGLEVVEEDPPAVAAPAQGRPAGKASGKAPPIPVSDDATADEKREVPRKKRKRKKVADHEQDKGMALFYMSQTPGEISLRMAEEEERKSLGILGKWKGVTLLGYHFTAGVFIGTVMLTTGLLFLAVLGVCYSLGIVASREIVVGALVYTGGGVVWIARSSAAGY
jgi:DNA-directed RNA polymerase subunit RPC12/RpoP